MAVEAFVSDQLTNARKRPVVMNETVDNRGKLRFAHFYKKAGVAGDANTTCDLCELPPGRVRVLGNLSRVAFTAFGAARVLDIGHRAYKKIDGEAEAEDLDAFDNDLDVSAAGAAALGNNISLDDTFNITSMGGVTIACQVTGGTWPLNGELKGYIAYLTD